MSGEGFFSTAFKLFTGADAADAAAKPDDGDGVSGERASAAAANEEGAAAGAAPSTGSGAADGSAAAQPQQQAEQQSSAAAAADTPPLPVSIRRSATVRGSVRAGGRAWDDEVGTAAAAPATPGAAGGSAAGGSAGGSAAGGSVGPRTGVAAGVSSPGGAAASSSAVAVLQPGQVSSRRLAEFTRCLEARSVHSDTLRRLAWFGVPARYRTAVWQILLGYLPASADRAADSLARKRQEYESIVATVTGGRGGGGGKSESEQRTMRQVLVDCPRTCPGIPLFHTTWVQRSLARVLTAYATRHFATGYVQGINDLATPFYTVFLSPWADLDSGNEVVDAIPKEDLAEVEADVYWCLTRLLEGIQSHYLHTQHGLHAMMAALRELCVRVDERLVVHLEKNDVEFKTFSFRWMNCLLLRELPLRLVLRLWDTYIAESTHAVRDGFEAFHVYVCAALLDKFKPKLLERSTHELLSFLQGLDKETAAWGVSDLEELLSKAYVFTQMFPGATTQLSS